MTTIAAPRHHSTRDARASSRESPAYERDYYAWIVEQAGHLAASRLDRLDLTNLAEEIEDLGKSEFRRYAGAYRVLLMHMLKWDHQPERRSKSWLNSIAAQRLRIGRTLAESPSLKARTAEAIAQAYEDARLEAATETGLDVGSFPGDCPYDFADLTTRQFDFGNR